MVTIAAGSTGVNNNSVAGIQAQPQVQPQTHKLSAKVRRMVQSIKEIVGNNFSDTDIYLALKDCNMDANETAQKLLNEDPFHEVKRKRDRKKENMGCSGNVDLKPNSENLNQGMKFRPLSDRYVRRGSYTQTASPGNAGANREFRVVRDNRVNRNTDRELKPALPEGSTSPDDEGDTVAAEKGLTGTSNNVKPAGARVSSQSLNGPVESQHRHIRDDRKAVSEEKRSMFPNTASQTHAVKPRSQNHSSISASSNSDVGVYSSTMDPVHVPSPDSRSSAAVGAIKREVGVVGGRRQSSDIKDSSQSSNSFSNSVLGRDGPLSESFRPFPAISMTDQVSHTNATEPFMSTVPGNRSALTNQYTSRQHQQVVGHQKGNDNTSCISVNIRRLSSKPFSASQHNKEWKPKSSQKSITISPGVIGTATKSSTPPADNSKAPESEAVGLLDKLSLVNINENQNVIIAQHIRVPESDRCRLTFGSFGVEFDSTRSFASGFQAIGVAEESNGDSSASLSASAPESSSDDTSAGKEIELLDDQVRNSGSDSPVSEHQLPDKSSSTPNLDNYPDIGLVRENSPTYTPSESQQHHNPPELPSFSEYDPQTGYDLAYFRPLVDETVRGQGLPSPHEFFTSHTSNNVPTSTMVQQQQQQQQQQAHMAQMYSQVHLSPFANLMPYRQLISPVYVPSLPMPGYSGNPAYAHPSNGNGYMLMPGGSSHLSANGLKYGIQQYKPVPGGSPTGFGNFSSQTGYAINAPGVVGSASGHEDASRIKYKDANMYVPNPQAETSEIWIQNPRELQGLQSAQYYNLPGQAAHAAYMPSHAGHASFNAAAAQSSHMQYSGLYPPPPPQAAPMASPHHLGPVMGGNVGVGVGVAPNAPGTQVGAYQQQPQIGHLNWATNF